jgi:hypothetical protein
MGFEQVQQQYNKAVNNQMKRRLRQGRDFFTKAEQAALKFYSQAFEKLGASIEGEKIFVGDLHAENPDMRGQGVEKFPTDSGHSEGGAGA